MKTTLEQLKTQYAKLQTKYKLPGFTELNEEFHIEKLTEHESETLLREIRQCIADKISSMSRFIEVFLNPSNAPLFVLQSSKNLNEEDNKDLEKIYKQLTDIELKSINLDVVYSEKDEAAFILEISKKWSSVKESFLKPIKKLSKKWKPEAKEEKSYLG